MRISPHSTTAFERHFYLETFSSSLATNVMPVAGKDPVEVLEVADEFLSRDEVAGSILFFTDGIARDQVPAFVAH